MKNLTQPRWTLDYLYRLQTTDIQSTGQNNRDELAAVQSALSQLIFKDGLRDLLQHPELGVSISPTLDASYADYLAQTQHPRTGYWGPWYRFGDELFMVQDLSFTFHIVQYRSGNIANWQLVVDSTFSIKELAYPAGWKPNDGAKYSNHNNYDVVTILFFGWPHMTLEQKKRARYEIQEMLTWCLTESLSNDCTEFKAAGDTELDSYYFGVRFLDRIGFWDRAKRFWLQTGLKIPAGLPTPNEICKQLKRGFEELEVDSETADNVKDILDIAECASSPRVASAGTTLKRA
jgi:hypothetical protein